VHAEFILDDDCPSQTNPERLPKCESAPKWGSDAHLVQTWSFAKFAALLQPQLELSQL